MHELCHHQRVESVNALLRQTDWSTLEDAYGPASEAPRQLMALLGDDGAARRAAVKYLNGAILHQRTIWSATAPAARVVAMMLTDPRTTTPVGGVGDPTSLPLRLVLISFLDGLARSCLLESKSDSELRAELARPVELATSDDDFRHLNSSASRKLQLASATMNRSTACARR